MDTMDIDIIKTNRYISQKTKTIVLDKQQYKCANNPLKGLICSLSVA